MTTIISSHSSTAAKINSIHSLWTNHPRTLFMVSLHPGYHDPPVPIHYHIYGLMMEICENTSALLLAVWTSARCGCLDRSRATSIMETRSMTKLIGIIGGAALLVAVPVSLQWSQKSVAYLSIPLMLA
jgi:hypothetical protein